MKTYSDDAVTRASLDEVARKSTEQIHTVDEKQTKQIKQLRLWVAASFLVNLGLLAAACGYLCNLV